MTQDRHSSMTHRTRPALRTAWMLLGLFVIARLATSTARADMPGDVPDKIRLEIGGMAAESFTEGAVGTTKSGIGASINFEDIFNLPENKQVARFDGYWHINKRQYLDFGYVTINRSGSRVLQEDVLWNGYTFQASAKVTAGFDTSFPYAAWRYDFLQLEQVHISGSAGINYLGLSASLRANGNVLDPNNNPVAGEVERKASVAFPVPQLGLQLDWALTRRLAVKIYTRQIYVSTSDIRGGIGENVMRLSWYMSRHFGITGGIDNESIDLKEYTSGETKSRFRYEVRGLAAYLNFAF